MDQELLRHPAEMLAIKWLRREGVEVSDVYWEGTRLLVKVNLPRSPSFVMWILRSANEPAYTKGEFFAVGHIPTDHFTAQHDKVMKGLLALFETEAVNFAWPEDPSRGEPNAPVLIFGGSRLELRLTYHCNENCIFCNTIKNAQNYVPQLDLAIQALEKGAEHGARKLVITGGEPLLVPWMKNLIQEAQGKYERVIVQTNAVLLNDSDALDFFAESGVFLLVSLHASNRQLSGQITGVPGLWKKKLVGMKAALDSGIDLTVNYVVCALNLHDFPVFPRFLKEEFGDTLKYLVVSYVAPNGRAWENRGKTMARYTTAAPVVLRGMQEAKRLGLEVQLAENCGIPTCIFPQLREFSEAMYFESGRKITVGPDKIKLPGCTNCKWDKNCSGIFKRYLEFFGLDEFKHLIGNSGKGKGN